MTLDERAERIAKLIVSANAIPFAVAGTQFQQQKVIEDAKETVLRELRASQSQDTQWTPLKSL